MRDQWLAFGPIDMAHFWFRLRCCRSRRRRFAAIHSVRTICLNDSHEFNKKIIYCVAARRVANDIRDETTDGRCQRFLSFLLKEATALEKDEACTKFICWICICIYLFYFFSISFGESYLHKIRNMPVPVSVLQSVYWHFSLIQFLILYFAYRSDIIIKLAGTNNLTLNHRIRCYIQTESPQLQFFPFNSISFVFGKLWAAVCCLFKFVCCLLLFF